MDFCTINPFSGELLKHYPFESADAIEQSLKRAEQGFRVWRAMSFAQRADCFLRLAVLLEEQKQGLGGLISFEMGKPITQAIAEVEKCAGACRVAAEQAEALLGVRYAKTAASKSFVRFDPIGTVLAIMPWNFPFWQVFRFATTALMAGNVTIVKHAPNTPGCAAKIADLFHAAEFPEGVYQNIFADVGQIPAMIADARIAAVTLTGSKRAGAVVASLAGQALKPSVLELGGSDPFLVLEDANVSEAAKTGAKSRCFNAGQTCVSAKRFIVQETRLEEFLDCFSLELRAIKVGDPSDLQTAMGPLARPDIKSTLVAQVEESRGIGALKLDLKHSGPETGNFFTPQVFTRVSDESPLWRDEIFGPVAAVRSFTTSEEGVRLANESSYGLGASIWSVDIERALRLAVEIEAGMVFVNEMVQSDPRLPVGGIKSSGYGRELSEEGYKAFANAKTVWVR